MNSTRKKQALWEAPLWLDKLESPVISVKQSNYCYFDEG
jgi:hypothetical protein